MTRLPVRVECRIYGITDVSTHHVRLDNGTTWSLPEPNDGDEYGVQHALRYRADGLGESATYTSRERMIAASEMSCYRALVDLPLSESRKVLRAIKAAMKMRREAKEATKL